MVKTKANCSKRSYCTLPWFHSAFLHILQNKNTRMSGKWSTTKPGLDKLKSRYRTFNRCKKEDKKEKEVQILRFAFVAVNCCNTNKRPLSGDIAPVTLGRPCALLYRMLVHVNNVCVLRKKYPNKQKQETVICKTSKKAATLPFSPQKRIQDSVILSSQKQWLMTAAYGVMLSICFY